MTTVFLDAGYTLIKPHPGLTDVCKAVCARHNLDVSVEQLQGALPEAEAYFFESMRRDHHLWGSDEKIEAFWLQYYARLLRPFIPAARDDYLSQVSRDMYDEFCQHTSWTVYPDVIPLLQMLRAKSYKVAIISDWGQQLKDIVLDLGLGSYVDHLVISSVVKVAKPNPLLYSLALQRIGSAPEESIHVGDTYVSDVLGARSVGISPVLLHRAGPLAGVDCPVITSLDQLPALLTTATVSAQVPA